VAVPRVQDDQGPVVAVHGGRCLGPVGGGHLQPGLRGGWTSGSCPTDQDLEQAVKEGEQKDQANA
jgi:hypothetical protein